MPTMPRRPCRYPGCRLLADKGEQYCTQHKKQADWEYNHYQRDPETRKKYGRAWKRIRDRHVQEHPLCEECLKQGLYKPAEEVHHIIPLNAGGTHARSNLISLCRSCHMKAHALLGTRTPHKE